MRILQWITLFAGVSIVSATWPDLSNYGTLPEDPRDLDLSRFNNHPNGQIDGAQEIKALAALREFSFEVDDVYTSTGLPEPSWTKQLRVLPGLTGGNLRGFVPISESIAQNHLGANYEAAGDGTWRHRTIAAASRIAGTYWGIPVERTQIGGNVGYRSVFGAVSPTATRMTGYPDTIKGLARGFENAEKAKGQFAWAKMLPYMTASMKANLQKFHRGMDMATAGRFSDAQGTLTNNAGVYSFDVATIPVPDPSLLTPDEIARADSHAYIAKCFLKTMAKVSTLSSYTGQTTYSAGCGSITKRYLFGRRLAKRAGNCMPDDIQIIGDDTMGASSMTTDDQLRAEVNSLRGIKALTGNQKILPNDMGEGFTVDPADSTELDPSSVMEGSLTGDEAWEAVEGSFNDILDNAPETVDRSLASKVLKMLKKNAQARIKALKEVPFGAPTDKVITAEARKMALERMAAKYLNTYGTHYQKDDTDDPSAANWDSDALERSLEMPFHDIDYRNLADLKDIAEGNLIDDVAALDSSVGGLEGSPTEQDGGLDYFRPELAVAGTTEYSKLWGFLGDKVDAVLKDPKTPKWKLLRARAMLSRAQKSIEVRDKELQNRQKEGGEITQLDIDEYEAMHEFYGKIGDSLAGRDIDSMPDTAEDKANPLPEFSKDPGTIPTLSPKTTFKPQKGKPMGWRGGIRAISDANRRWKHATRPFSVGGNKKN